MNYEQWANTPVQRPTADELRRVWDRLEPIKTTTYEDGTIVEHFANGNTRTTSREYREALERLVQAALVDRGPTFYDFIMSQIEPEKSQKEPERVESMHFL